MGFVVVGGGFLFRYNSVLLVEFGWAGPKTTVTSG